MAIFQRYSKNPILTPNKDNWWESKAVFNCSVSFDGKNVHMLYRAIGEYDHYISRIGYASSSDGFQFDRRHNIAIHPTEDYEIGNRHCYLHNLFEKYNDHILQLLDRAYEHSGHQRIPNN